MPSTCRQLSKTAAPGEVRLADVACPGPARDQVLVAPLLVGLCGSDLRLLRNEKAHAPGAFGHEVAARVLEVGSEVAGIEAGALVTVNPVNCENDDDIIGYNGRGFLASRLLLGRDVLVQQRLIALPPGVTARLGVFAEPLACCVRAQRSLGTALAGADVVVIGSGSFGLLHYLLARHAGARVLLTARSMTRISEAMRLGIVAADQVALSSDRGHALYGRADVVIVTANGTAALRSAAQWAAPGGTLLMFGGLDAADAADGIDFAALRRARAQERVSLDGKPVNLSGSYGTGNDDFRRALALIESRALPLERLITHEIGLDELPAALGGLASGTVDGRPVIKLLVRCA